jgi:SulP family sulfate permease
MKQYFNLFDFTQKSITERKFCLTVAMTMIPESLSFAILAGFPPLVGLYAAFIMGLVTAILEVDLNGIWRSRATVIVLIALMKSNGLEYVFAAVALAGVIQILIGFLNLVNS